MSEYEQGFKKGYTQAIKGVLHGIRMRPDVTVQEIQDVLSGIFDGDDIRESFFEELKKVSA
jgi:hypothetical protein